jgi:hypothetical protein
MTTLAVWATVGGTTGHVRLKLAANANGDPATATPSIETATVLAAPRLLL